MKKLLALLLVVATLLTCAAAEETIIADKENGVWSYTSETFSVTINRITDTENKLIWYECDLLCSAESPLMSVASNPKKPGSRWQHPEKIARDNQLVFAINDDFFGDRVNQDKRVGIIIRKGELLYKKTYKSGSRNFPNLDTMVFYQDGSITVHESQEFTGDEYLAMGATDVFAFGPYLIRDGVINPNLTDRYENPEPRVCIGMVEPYHYKVLVVEGRSKKSKGVPVSWLADRMLEMGCVNAFNLDGGQTAALVFMGNKINTTGKFGETANIRNLSGMIGAGVSEQVPAYKD